MDKLGVKEGEVITHPMVTRSIEKAQKRVEAFNFGIRKHLLEYDDVMNQQREVIYGRRRELLYNEDTREVVEHIVSEYLDTIADEFMDPHSAPDMWDQDELQIKLRRQLQISSPPREIWGKLSKPADWINYLLDESLRLFDRRRELYGADRYDPFIRWVALRTVDDKWKDHLYDMDRLKEGVGLRAYGQRDPLIEYKKEGFEMFSALLDNINEETVRIVFNSVIQEPRDQRPTPAARMTFVKAEASTAVAAAATTAESDDETPIPQTRGSESGVKKEPVRVMPVVGRNDPCSCGSGKKYKHCHGA